MAEAAESPKGGYQRRFEDHERERGAGTSPGVTKFQGLDRVGRSEWQGRKGRGRVKTALNQARAMWGL